MKGTVRRIASVALILAASLAVVLGFAFSAVSNNAMTGPSSAQADVAPAYMHLSGSSRDVAPLRVIQAPVKAAHVSHQAAAIRDYQVLKGDNLSLIAKHMYGKATDWPVIYYANKTQIKFPDFIYIGENLVIPALPAHIPAPPKILAPSVPVQTVKATTDGDGDNDGDQSDTQTSTAAAASAAAPVSGSSSSGSLSMQHCIKMAEEGGSYAWGPGNGGGAYQFLFTTWVRYGGAPSLYGNASPAYQDQIFWNAVAANGYNDWAPYDGC